MAAVLKIKADPHLYTLNLLSPTIILSIQDLKKKKAL